jgi:nicotinate-nucleotide adenylyltransferase
MRVGLFFGTFNPIHLGHLILGNHMTEYTDLDEVWFVITPQSPFKMKKTMLANNHRMVLANLAVENFPKLKTSTVEFKLSPPYYTINTLVNLEELYPNHEFSLIMGEDNIRGFHKWKNYEVILENYSILVYPRIADEVGEIPALLAHPNVQLINAPRVELSSSFIRKGIKEGKNIRAMLPDAVWNYIDEMNFYRN